MPKNYYEVLGITKDATDSEIKKAYRGLSLRYHPDRSKDENAISMFQEIGEAYEILKDPQKKSQYDAELNGFFSPEMGGLNFHFTHGGGVPNDINDIFNMMAGMAGMAGMGGNPDIHMFHNDFPMGGGGGRFFNIQNLQKPMPIIKNIIITLEQAYHGVSIPIEIERKYELNKSERETIYVDIPAGIDENEIIILRDKGHIINDVIKGDIKITITIEKHSYIQRHGMDIIYKKTVNLKEALCGFSFEFKHLNGKQFCINNNTSNSKTIIKPNFRKIIPNMGMIRNNNVGNLIIEFIIEFPDSLTEQQIEGLNGIL